MKCPKCESDNREGVNFCEKYVAKFELVCPSCKVKIPLGKKFCRECDQSLSLPSEHAPQEFSFDQKYKRFKNTFRTWNELCWRESLYGLADKVIDGCESAVNLEPENGRYRDSRGLARASTGNYAGAIQDFTYYVRWNSENLRMPGESAKRKAWIQKLHRGGNPFDEATIKELRAPVSIKRK